MFAVVVALVILLLGFGFITYVDATFGTLKDGRGVVTGKRTVDALYAQTSTRTFRKQEVYPPLWKLCVMVDSLTDCHSVSQEEFNHFELGMRVFVTYTTGFFTGKLYIKSLY